MPPARPRDQEWPTLPQRAREAVISSFPARRHLNRRRNNIAPTGRRDGLSVRAGAHLGTLRGRRRFVVPRQRRIDPARRQPVVLPFTELAQLHSIPPVAEI